MKKFIFLFFCIFNFISPINVTIVTQPDVYSDYLLFLDKRDPLTIKNYSGSYARRDVLELVMVLQALKKGELKDFKYKIITSPTDRRDIAFLEKGDADIRGTSIWDNEIDSFANTLYKSVPVIKNGQFEAGFYTVLKNQKALNSKSFDDIKNLTVVSSKLWTVDWKTLTNLNIHNLVDVAKWESMVNLVKNNRADILLAPFQPTSDMSFEAEGAIFYPIKNIKISLDGSRHFAVSKVSKNGKQIFEALNKGLILMEKEGLINKIYIDSGFFNPSVKNWKKVN